MVCSPFSKTAISLLLGMGYKYIIYQMKGNMFLHAKIVKRIQLNLIWKRNNYKTIFPLLFFEPSFLNYYHTHKFVN